jgi:protein-tyrosine kinase
MERIQAAIRKAKKQRDAAGIDTPKEPQDAHSADSTALWARLPKFSLDAKRMIKNRVVTYAQSDPSHFTFDMLRAKLQRALRQNGWTSVGITSPTIGCGKTTVCLNLAFSLARQKDCRVVVADLDLRQPRIAEILGVKGEKSIEQLLKGLCPIERVFMSHGGNLAVGACGRPVPYSAELLQSSGTAQAVKELQRGLKADIVLFDMPPMLLTDDVFAFLPNLDSVMVVAAAEVTTLDEIDKCVRELSDQTNMLGVVLNKCRHVNETSGYYAG